MKNVTALGYRYDGYHFIYIYVVVNKSSVRIPESFVGERVVKGIVVKKVDNSHYKIKFRNLADGRVFKISKGKIY